MLSLPRRGLMEISTARSEPAIPKPNQTVFQVLGANLTGTKSWEKTTTCGILVAKWHRCEDILLVCSDVLVLLESSK